MQVSVEVSRCHRVEHLAANPEIAVDSRLRHSQFIAVLSSLIVLSDVGVMALYISSPPPPELPSLGTLLQMATISRSRPLESMPMAIHEPDLSSLDADAIADFQL